MRISINAGALLSVPLVAIIAHSMYGWPWWAAIAVGCLFSLFVPPWRYGK